MDITDSVPASAKLIGTVKIGEAGMTIDCDYELVTSQAVQEARKAGGNILKITEHIYPDMRSSCHRIRAEIYYLENLEDLLSVIRVDPAVFDSTVNYALLHVYRPGGAGALVSYMLHLGEKELCRVSFNSHETIMITEEGPNEIWAQTESKVTVPAKFEFGKEYYLRCGVTMGILVGRPMLMWVDWATGNREFKAMEGN